MLSWTDPHVMKCLTKCATILKGLVAGGKQAPVVEIESLMIQLRYIASAVPMSSNESDARHRTSLDTILQLLKASVVARRKASVKMETDNVNVSTQEVPDSQSDVIDDDDDEETADADIPKVSASASRSTSASSTSNTGAKSSGGDELDSFAGSRKAAIEATIASDTSVLPKFSEISGLSDAKGALFEALVDPILYPDWFAAKQLQPWKAVLLFGPPGTGKTALSQAIAGEIKAVLYQISSSDLISSWSGQSEKLIRELFDHAIEQSRTSIIFIDEVDSLCRVRSSSEDDSNRRVKTELLVQIQRLQDTRKVVLVCATNCPWDLDPAFLRRFEKKIYVGLPDLEARIAMLGKKLKNTSLSSGVSVTWIAESTHGFSGDDLRRFASELAYTQFRLFKEARHCNGRADVNTPLQKSHVVAVLAQFQPSVDETQLSRFQEYMSK